MPKAPRPYLFFFLILPFGASFGYVSVAIPFVAHERGVPVEAAMAVIAAAFAVHGWKFLWAPVVDATLTRKRWYVISLALVIAGTVASAAMPIRAGHMAALTLVVVASQIGLTLMGMACEGFLALGVAAEHKGRASGWYQAGNFFGLGAGGWLALKLTGALPRGWMVGAVVGAAMVLCALPLLAFDEPKGHAEKLPQAVRALGRDLLGLVTSAAGLVGLAIALSPVSAGAAGNSWTTLPADWGMGPGWHGHFLSFTFSVEDVVGLVTGLLGSIISAAGCMAGGVLADKMNRKVAYALAGGCMGTTALAMALGPRTPAAFVTGALVYSLFQGLSFAAFTAFVLETIGGGAAATKYNIFASLANLAISYMTRVDGLGYARWGARGLLLTDASATAGGIAVVVALVFGLRYFGKRAATSSPSAA